MKLANWGKILGIAVILVVTAAIAAEVAYPSATLRYKITVNIHTPEGIKTGSAVREVFIQRQPELPESVSHIVPKGEAVVVDLGKRGIVFALFSSSDYQKIFKAFPGPPGLTPEGLKYYSSLKTAKAELTPDRYPMMVTFKDLSDPASVLNLLEVSNCFEQDKNGTCIREGSHVTKDRFEDIFGKGVGIKNVTIEMTNEPVTQKIIKWLSWLPDYYDKRLDGNRFGNFEKSTPFSNTLSSGVFSSMENNNGNK